MRYLLIFLLAITPTSIALGQTTRSDISAKHHRQRSLMIKLGADAGYQLTSYSAGFLSGDSGVYHGPAVSADLFVLWRVSPYGNLGTGLRLSVGYGSGSGTFSDGEGFSPAGGTGRPVEECGLNAWYLRSNVLYVLASDYYWIGAGLGGRYQQQEVEILANDDRGDFEFVFAGGLELPLGRFLSLTTKVEVNSNLIMTTSVAGTGGLKLRF